MKADMNTELDNRLRGVASFVRNDAFLIDVGTDHAYLPIALVSAGHIIGALACDINKGPCERAEKNISDYGMSEKIRVKQTDGLCGISFDRPKTDIVIAGMGGALIQEIIEKAPLAKNSRTRLILQPMRNAPDVRRYLYENGFDIIGEALAADEDRIYEIICAVFDGKKRGYTALSLLLGEKNIENKKQYPALFSAFCEKNATALKKKIAGLKTSGADFRTEEDLLSEVLSQKEV